MIRKINDTRKTLIYTSEIIVSKNPIKYASEKQG
jgi:hypothetical protein